MAKSGTRKAAPIRMKYNWHTIMAYCAANNLSSDVPPTKQQYDELVRLQSFDPNGDAEDMQQERFLRRLAEGPKKEFMLLRIATEENGIKYAVWDEATTVDYDEWKKDDKTGKERSIRPLRGDSVRLTTGSKNAGDAAGRDGLTVGEAGSNGGVGDEVGPGDGVEGEGEDEDDEESKADRVPVPAVEDEDLHGRSIRRASSSVDWERVAEDRNGQITILERQFTGQMQALSLENDRLNERLETEMSNSARSLTDLRDKVSIAEKEKQEARRIAQLNHAEVATLRLREITANRLPGDLVGCESRIAAAILKVQSLLHDADLSELQLWLGNLAALIMRAIELQDEEASGIEAEMGERDLTRHSSLLGVPGAFERSGDGRAS